MMRQDSLPPRPGEGGREATGWGGLGDAGARLVSPAAPVPTPALGRCGAAKAASGAKKPTFDGGASPINPAT